MQKTLPRKISVRFCEDSGPSPPTICYSQSSARPQHQRSALKSVEKPWCVYFQVGCICCFCSVFACAKMEVLCLD